MENLNFYSQITSLKGSAPRHEDRSRNWREFLGSSVALSLWMGFLLTHTSLGIYHLVWLLLICGIIFSDKKFDLCGRFAWDEAKYPTMSPLKEIVDGIHTQVAKIEDDLKVYILLCYVKQVILWGAVIGYNNVGDLIYLFSSFCWVWWCPPFQCLHKMFTIQVIRPEWIGGIWWSKTKK